MAEINESARLRRLVTQLNRERTKQSPITDKEVYGETQRCDRWDFVDDNLDLPRRA